MRIPLAKRYDILVIGGGHAGIEAAWASARLGAQTALVTMQPEAIGRMSCNPAIGGPGKGQMVREIDALGGLMGLAIDRAGIHFRMLNASKGPAVWAPRAQADRDLYSSVVQSLLGEARSLDIVVGSVKEIPTAIGQSARTERLGNGAFRAGDGMVSGDKPRVLGVVLKDGRRIEASAVILTTGTFMNALMHCGRQQTEGGRVGEASAKGLSVSLRALGFELGRLKTGTPPRVHRDTVDYDKCEIQFGDEIPSPFSFLTDYIPQRQIQCWITWTNEDVHELIRANLHRAPMYSGQIRSQGPRYCPSIEDKVVRFADKPRHQIFLEPEGYDNERIYCNGISTSLPADVQEACLQKISGLGDAKILQHGYAVEYDFIPTYQTKATLESKLVGGLFLAGQINGTSGYEEAAGQGLVAGVNAVQWLDARDPFILGRDEAYLGVMIDDLITRPPTEPYRMFTSRAEYRLRLRADNADQRLTPIGRNFGLVDGDRWSRFEEKQEALRRLDALCQKVSVDNGTLAAWIRRPDADLKGFADAIPHVDTKPFCTDALWHMMIDAKYSGYVVRQARQIDRFRRLETLLIPDTIDYATLPGLRAEAREQFIRVGPRTMGQASRISGITPADITTLWIHLKARGKARLAG